MTRLPPVNLAAPASSLQSIFRLLPSQLRGLRISAVQFISGISTRPSLPFDQLTAASPCSLTSPAAYDEMPYQQQSPNPHAPRLLFYNDSFAASLMQFLAPNFSHAYYAWNSSVSPIPARARDPDVVVNEFVERKLHEALPIDSPEISDEKLP
jgi:hypothetical protein